MDSRSNHQIYRCRKQISGYQKEVMGWDGEVGREAQLGALILGLRSPAVNAKGP